MTMNFAEAICDRMKDLEAFTVVINDRQVHDITPNGHMTNVEDEECAVLAATPMAGLFVKRIKDGQEMAFQWNNVGSLRFVL